MKKSKKKVASTMDERAQLISNSICCWRLWSSHDWYICNDYGYW